MKRIICLILALAMMMSMSLCLISCGDDTDGGDETGGTQTPEKTTYTVTVTDDSGNPVKDAIVFINGMPFPSDNEGKITYTTAKQITATVNNAPTGYEYDKLGVEQSFDANGNLSIVLTKKAQAGTKYTIRVVDQNGDAVVGAKVQMCESENEGICLIPVTTDESGEAFYTAEEKGYKAALTSLPEGYEQISEGYVYFEDGVAVIVVNKI